MSAIAMAELSVQRRFPGESVQVGKARAWVLEHLPANCPKSADVALVVSELVTNAIVHSVSGMGGSFAVRAEFAPGAVEISVADQGPRPVPARREPGASGWGLACIVGDLADEVQVSDRPAGRIVRCRLTWPTGRS